MFQLVAVFVFISSMGIPGARAQDLACQEVPADILFVLDSSSSIGPGDFQKELSFAANLTSKFDLGPKVVQIAVMTFAQWTVIRFPYDKYTDNDALYKAIMDIDYSGGSTGTATALETARNFIFDASKGARSSTPLAKVVIVMTDGRSNSFSDTVREAGLLKDAGALVLSIGIGNAIRKELEEIASNHTTNVFEVDSFDALETIRSTLITQTCEEALTNQCASLADIILVIQSGGLTETTFKQELAFAANLTKGFILGPNDIRVGAVTYGTNPRKLFDLKEYSDNKDLSQAIMSSSFFNGSTNTAEALRYITRQGMFNMSLGGRPHRNATQIVIVLTNGQSDDLRQTDQAANELKSNGVQIMAIGTSSANTNELLLLASDQGKVFQAKSYEVLGSIKETIAKRTCEARKTPWSMQQSVEVSCEKPIAETGEYLKDLIIDLEPNQDVCSSFIAIIKCPSGLVYDRKKKLCQDKVLVDGCNVPGQLPTNSANKKPWSMQLSVKQSCVKPVAESGELLQDLIVDLVPFESDCSNFIAEIKCPLGLVYDLEKKLCRDPVLVENCTITEDSMTTDSMTTDSMTTTERTRNAASDLVYPPVVVLCLCILINHLLHKRLLLGVGGHGVPGRLLDMGLQQTGPMLTQTS